MMCLRDVPAVASPLTEYCLCLQPVSSRPHPQYWPLLVFLRRDVRALSPVLPLRLPD